MLQAWIAGKLRTPPKSRMGAYRSLKQLGDLIPHPSPFRVFRTTNNQFLCVAQRFRTVVCKLPKISLLVAAMDRARCFVVNNPHLVSAPLQETFRVL